jgi:hypothetical protein
MGSFTLATAAAEPFASIAAPFESIAAIAGAGVTFETFSLGRTFETCQKRFGGGTK